MTTDLRCCVRRTDVDSPAAWVPRLSPRVGRVSLSRRLFMRYSLDIARRSAALVVIAVVALLIASPARASFHEWKIDQVFSNAAGTQQFIEMSEAFNGEQFFKTDAGGPFGPAHLFSGSKAFIFPNDLPLPAVVGHDTAG